MYRRLIPALLLWALMLAPAGCDKQKAASCDMAPSSCTARAMLAVVMDAQQDYYDDHKSWAQNFEALKSHLDHWPAGSFIIEQADAKVFVPVDRSYEIRIKLYPDHTRLKISPQPQTPDGHYEPFCIMQRYDAKLLEKCDILL